MSYKIIATKWNHFRTHQFSDVNTEHCYNNNEMDTIMGDIIEKELGAYHQENATKTNLLEVSMDKDCAVAFTPALSFADASIGKILKATIEQLQNQGKSEWVIYSPLHGGGHWTTLEIRKNANNVITCIIHDPLGKKEDAKGKPFKGEMYFPNGATRKLKEIIYKTLPSSSNNNSTSVKFNPLVNVRVFDEETVSDETQPLIDFEFQHRRPGSRNKR